MTRPAAPVADSHQDPAARSLAALLRALVDQEAATVAVAPSAAADGHWFGAGSAAVDDDGTVWLVGRFRDAGDSRRGLDAGTRGRALALYRSDDGARSFRPVRSFTKADLSRHGPVVSIEGSALARTGDGGWELLVALEKDVAYPAEVAALQKPGTGVWSIDRLTGPTPDAVDPAGQAPLLSSADPETLHVKDPVLAREGDRTLLWASVHPASWASSNTAFAVREHDDGPFAVRTWQFAARGACWDVAVTRITHRWPVPAVGAFAWLPPHVVYLYDGAECMRPHDPDPRAATRPRGSSCEELGGALWGPADGGAPPQRLSRLAPLFVSPHGTGCSRYLSTLALDDGLVALWQQGQPDGSQPLVTHRLPWERVHALLAP